MTGWCWVLGRVCCEGMIEEEHRDRGTEDGGFEESWAFLCGIPCVQLLLYLVCSTCFKTTLDIHNSGWLVIR